MDLPYVLTHYAKRDPADNLCTVCLMPLALIEAETTDPSTHSLSIVPGAGVCGAGGQRLSRARKPLRERRYALV